MRTTPVGRVLVSDPEATITGVTSEQLEALWSLPPAVTRPGPRLPGRLAVHALRCVGLEPSPELLERARLESWLLYDGGAIDVWE